VKKLLYGLVAALAISSLSACNQNETVEPKLTLEKTEATVIPWNFDDSHSETFKAKLTLNGKPVVGAEVETSLKLTKTTDKNGEISFIVNKDKVQKKTITVVDADEAKVDGKKIDKKTRKLLVGLRDELMIQFPIQITKVNENQTDPSLVDVHGQAVLGKNHEFPSFVPSKYKIAGSIKDANGNPVEGATVNMRRDGVEGFTMSNPSNKNGEYFMYYLPEDEEDHYMVVILNDTVYTLPANKVFVFPDDIGINIDITLPKDGTVIEDKPPTLVVTAAPGAYYKGTLIGVNVSKDVNYSISIPKRDGSFILTLPKSEWEKNPTFFETIYEGFLKEEKKPGDSIDSTFIPKVKEQEPNQIEPKKD
jgi:hypothetical protein